MRASGLFLSTLVRTGLLLLVLSQAVTPGAATAAPDEVPLTVQIYISRDFSYMMDPKEILAATKGYTDQVAEKISKMWRPLQFRIGTTPPLDVLAEEMAGEAAIGAYITTTEYVRLKEMVDVVPLAVITRGEGMPSNRSSLIVRASSGSEGLADLRGKTFVYVNESSTSGYIFPQWLLHRAGLPEIREFFGRRIQVSKEKSALFAVLLGEADAAAVSDVILEVVGELNPGMRKSIRVLERSDPMPNGVIVIPRSLEGDHLRATRKCLFETPEMGQRLQNTLRFLKLTGIREAGEEDLAGVVEIVGILDAKRRRFLDPVCGRRLALREVHSRVPVGKAQADFCSAECRDTYLDRTERSRAGAEKPLVIVGLVLDRMFDRPLQDGLATAQMLHDEFSEIYGLELVVELLPDMDHARQNLRSGRIRALQIGAPGYVRLKREFALRTLARAHVTDEYYSAMLLVDARKEFGSLGDLRGKTLAMTVEGDSSQEIYLRSLLLKFGKPDLFSFFDGVVRCPSEESAIRAVALRQADVALVGSRTYELLSELQPGVCRHLAVMDLSQALVTGPFCYHPDLDPEIVKAIRDYFGRIHARPRARQMLTYFKAARMVEVDDGDYDCLRRMMEALER